MGELISVIINAYNSEKYIRKCIDSVINQTYKNIEIVVINDGSTDNTLEILNSYDDSRIKIITQKNKGLALSRNVGIDNSNGKYIYFLDADDLIEKDTIEYLYNICKKYDVLISTCRPIEIYDYNFEIRNEIEKVSIISSEDMLKKILISEYNELTIWNKLIRKDLFCNIRFEDRLIDDSPITYKLALATNRIAYSNQIKYCYMIRNEGMSRDNNIEFLTDVYKATFERYKYIKNIHPYMIENEIAMLNTILWLYLKEDKKIQQLLKKQEAIKLSKELFSFKILISKIRFNDKIRYFLFRINPNLYKIIMNNYLQLKNKYLNLMNKRYTKKRS